MSQTRAIVQSVSQLTPTILGLSMVRADGRDFPSFLPGQYATLSFPGYQRLKGERSFSISGSAIKLAQMEFGIRIGGPYTSALRNLQRGDLAMVASPYGQFTFDAVRDQSAVMIAGGIGVTPFMSMIRTANDEQWKNDITLLYSVRSMSEAAYAEELDTIETENKHFHVIYVVADGVVPKNSNRHVAGRITPEVFSVATQKNPAGRSFFLCGPPVFMGAMTRIMRQQGITPGMIRSERFAVAGTAIIEPHSWLPKVTFAAWGTASAILLAAIIRVEQDHRRQVNAALAPVITTTSTTTTTTSVNENSNTSAAITNVAPVTNATTPSSGAVTPTTPSPIVPRAPTVTTPTTPPPVAAPIQPQTRVS